MGPRVVAALVEHAANIVAEKPGEEDGREGAQDSSDGCELRESLSIESRGMESPELMLLSLDLERPHLMLLSTSTASDDDDDDDELCDAVTYVDIKPGEKYCEPWGCGCALLSETLGATYRTRREQVGVARISPSLLSECPGCGWSEEEGSS